jgi:hypothetical protein
MGLMGAAATSEASANTQESSAPPQEPAGMPPAFGTAKPVGPEVSEETFAEAEKLVQMNLESRHSAGDKNVARKPGSAV